MIHPNKEVMSKAIELAKRGYEESGFAIGAIVEYIGLTYGVDEVSGFVMLQYNP